MTLLLVVADSPRWCAQGVEAELRLRTGRQMDAQKKDENRDDYIKYLPLGRLISEKRIAKRRSIFSYEIADTGRPGPEHEAGSGREQSGGAGQ